MDHYEIEAQSIQRAERRRIVKVLRGYLQREAAHMQGSEDDRVRSHFKGRVNLLQEVIRKVSRAPKP